ncbi:hypothetical protein RIF29_31657 [Crotalaria pallida]|uniref:Aluminum-activated malate transporter n=1 Tax=Crotalaria pallida TaxID=3830 RepID=A0AAN9EI59_CROPI
MAHVEGNQNSSEGATKGWRQGMMALLGELKAKLVEVMLKLKKLGEEDPRRVIHSLKVGLAITLVSTFYYLDPLYHSFGSSAMWAVFTVIVVSEFSVGATLGKGLNRGLATLVAGAMGLGSYYLASSTGDIVQPIILGAVVFLLVAGVTYIRFFPQMKARYDYGLLVFILTFCLVSVSGNREDKIIDIAKKRVTSILIGGLISVLVCIFVYPIWAGDDLHNLISKNIEKLGNFLEGFGDEYFIEGGECNKSFLQGYKTVLHSKHAEENLANFARLEPGHGNFLFRHPWKQYLKIGSLSRQCAYRIDVLNGFLNSAKTPSQIKSKLQEPCIKMSTETGKALKELAVAINKMVPPSVAEQHMTKSKIAAMNLLTTLKIGLFEGTNLVEAIPVVTVASLLVDVVYCTDKLAESINELSSLAKFKNKDCKVAPQHLTSPKKKEAQQPFDCDNSGCNYVIEINQAATNLSQIENPQLLSS